MKNASSRQRQVAGRLLTDAINAGLTISVWRPDTSKRSHRSQNHHKLMELITDAPGDAVLTFWHGRLNVGSVTLHNGARAIRHSTLSKAWGDVADRATALDGRK